MSTDEQNNSNYNNETEKYPETSGQSWTDWSKDPNFMENFKNRPPPNYPYHTSTMNHPPANIPGHLMQGNRFTLYQNQRPYFRNRFQNPYHQYGGVNSPPYGWQRNQTYKRIRQDGMEGDPSLRSSKKRKKPLSQNVPTKKEWTIEDAQCALATEKAFNKKSKNSLIIKFPDQELNKDIVTQFHPSIENVHFQQPCTARFCFVTLQDSANPDEVISLLNNQKFGEGVLTVEYKKDREEDQIILPDDIDPLTLYVGNLAQEVTKDDILNLYPNNKRIDIGFAKKMKFTRYAFIGFRTAAESIDAFKRTHNKQMYNKSLIVRFRRLHGTIGMPGENKGQNTSKSKDDAVETSSNVTNTQTNNDDVVPVEEINDSTDNAEIIAPVNTIANLSAVKIKQERSGSVSSEEDRDYKSIYQDDFEPDSPEFTWNQKPKVKQETDVKVKTEFNNSTNTFNVQKVKSEGSTDNINVKPEPPECDDDVDIAKLYHGNDEPQETEENDNKEEVDLFADMMDFDKIYENMMNHKHKISMLKNSSKRTD